jgi:hypothetical protein
MMKVFNRCEPLATGTDDKFSHHSSIDSTSFIIEETPLQKITNLSI